MYARACLGLARIGYSSAMMETRVTPRGRAVVYDLFARPPRGVEGAIFLTSPGLAAGVQACRTQPTVVWPPATTKCWQA